LVAQSCLTHPATAPATRLEEEKRRLEGLIQELRAEIAKVLAASGDQTEELQELEQKLAVAEEKVQELEAELGEAADAGPVARPRPRIDAGPPPPRGLDDAQFLAGIAAQQIQIESCMGEWLERKEGESTTLVVTLSVAPDGQVRSTSLRGKDPTDPAAVCVDRAVGRAKFAPAGAITHGEVTVVVEAGQIRVSPKKTGAAAAGQTIDLD
jgi:hypothetical protein